MSASRCAVFPNLTETISFSHGFTDGDFKAKIICAKRGVVEISVSVCLKRVCS